MHRMDANKMPREKARWDLHKNATCCLGQILKIIPSKTAAIRPFTSHLKSIQVRQTRHAGYCRRSNDKLINDILLWTSSYGYASRSRPPRTYLHQHCVDIRYSLEDLPEVMDDRNGWRERETGKSMLSAKFDDDNDDDLWFRRKLVIYEKLVTVYLFMGDTVNTFSDRIEKHSLTGIQKLLHFIQEMRDAWPFGSMTQVVALGVHLDSLGFSFSFLSLYSSDIFEIYFLLLFFLVAIFSQNQKKWNHSFNEIYLS